MLGLRTWFDDMVLDPVLPRRADGLTLDLEYEGRAVRWLYHVTGDGFSPREVRVNGQRLPADQYLDNRYRPGGLLVSKRAVGDALDRAENLVEIVI